MNKIKHTLLAVVLVTSFMPVHAADKPASGGPSNLPMAAAIGTVCAVAATGAAYCAYQWYMKERHWSIAGITKEIEQMIDEEIPNVSTKLDWNGLDDFLHNRRSLVREHGRLSLKIRYSVKQGTWKVTETNFRQGTAPLSDEEAGLLVVEAEYDKPVRSYFGTGNQSEGVERKTMTSKG